jgi:hypothetical protein
LNLSVVIDHFSKTLFTNNLTSFVTLFLGLKAYVSSFLSAPHHGLNDIFVSSMVFVPLMMSEIKQRGDEIFLVLLQTGLEIASDGIIDDQGVVKVAEEL